LPSLRALSSSVCTRSFRELRPFSRTLLRQFFASCPSPLPRLFLFPCLLCRLLSCTRHLHHARFFPSVDALFYPPRCARERAGLLHGRISNRRDLLYPLGCESKVYSSLQESGPAPRVESPRARWRTVSALEAIRIESAAKCLGQLGQCAPPFSYTLGCFGVFLFWIAMPRQATCAGSNPRPIATSLGAAPKGQAHSTNSELLKLFLFPPLSEQQESLLPSRPPWT